MMEPQLASGAPIRKGEVSATNQAGPALTARIPRWRVELRLFLRQGPVRYVRVLRHYRRFQRAVREREL